MEDPTPLWVLEVQDDTALVAVEGVERCGAALGSASRRWPGTPLFEADDVGTQVTQNHGAIGSRATPGKVDNLDAFKRSAHVALLYYLPAYFAQSGR